MGPQIRLTSIDMAEGPWIIMQVSGHQFLGRWLNGEILHAETPQALLFKKKKKKKRKIKWQVTVAEFWIQKIKLGMNILYTRGGKIFSAARRGTEKPPWVLVSLAVSVLQKNSICGLFDLRASSDANNISLSNCITVPKKVENFSS